MELVTAYEFTCPYCDATIIMQLELLYGEQQYIEDCEVCCQPIAIHYTVSESYEISYFSASQEN